jgi:hypothetical protein
MELHMCHQLSPAWHWLPLISYDVLPTHLVPDLRALAGTLLRTLLIASLGGLAVHYLETVRSPAAAASKRAAVDSTGNSGRGRKAVRQAEQEAEEEGRQFRSRVRGLFAGLGRKERVRVEPAALAI